MNEKSMSEFNSSICETDVVSYYKVKKTHVCSLVNDFSYWHGKYGQESKDSVRFDFNSESVYLSEFVLITRSKWYRSCLKKFKKQASRDPDIFGIYDEDGNALLKAIANSEIQSIHVFYVKKINKSIFQEMSKIVLTSFQVSPGVFTKKICETGLVFGYGLIIIYINCKLFLQKISFLYKVSYWSYNIRAHFEQSHKKIQFLII